MIATTWGNDQDQDPHCSVEGLEVYTEIQPAHKNSHRSKKDRTVISPAIEVKGQQDFIMTVDFFGGGWLVEMSLASRGRIFSRTCMGTRRWHSKPPCLCLHELHVRIQRWQFLSKLYSRVERKVKDGAAISGHSQLVRVPFKEMATPWHHARGRKQLIVVAQSVLPHIPSLQWWALSSK